MRLNHSIEAYLSFNSFAMLQGNWQPPSHSYHVHVFSDIELWCFSFVTLFNLQGARPAPLRRGTFTILPQVSRFVKYFFRLFSKSFFVLLRFGTLRSKAWLVYHSFPGLSSTFFIFLEKLFSAPRSPAPSPTARLIYHTSPTLSTAFFHFLKVFFSNFQRHFLSFVI